VFSADCLHIAAVEFFEDLLIPLSDLVTQILGDVDLQATPILSEVVRQFAANLDGRRFWDTSVDQPGRHLGGKIRQDFRVGLFHFSSLGLGSQWLIEKRVQPNSPSRRPTPIRTSPLRQHQTKPPCENVCRISGPDCSFSIHDDTTLPDLASISTAQDTPFTSKTRLRPPPETAGNAPKSVYKQLVKPF